MEEKFTVNWCRVSRPAIPFIEFTNEVVNNALNVQEDFLSSFQRRMDNPLNLFMDDLPIYLKYFLHMLDFV